MALPVIDSPIFSIELPSTKNTLRFRPFTVKEEKLLLLASESEDVKTVSDTIKQVLNNCFIDEVDINSLAVFDVEYVFIKLRAKSVNNIIELAFKDDHDKEVKTEVDLEDIIVEFDEEHSNQIQLSDKVLLTMKYPSFSMFEAMSGDKGESDMSDILNETIDKVVNGDEVLSLKDYSKEEIATFTDSFTSKNMRDIEKFFATLPKLKMDVEYKDSEGNSKVREVVGLQNFFTS
jgi:hypothetical protein